MHVHRQHNGHQCHENRGADGEYRIAVFACTEYRYQRDDGEYDGHVYENRTEEFGQYRFAKCQRNGNHGEYDCRDCAFGNGFLRLIAYVAHKDNTPAAV